MPQDQEVDYRSILVTLLRNPEDIDLALQISRKLVGPQKPSSQPQIQSEQNGSDQKSDATAIQIFPGQFFGKSQMQAAAEILRLARKPQKTKTIIEAMRQAELKIGGKDPEGTIYRSLLRSREFMKVAPDTWGLSEWYPDAKVRPMIAPVKKKNRPAKPRNKTAEVPKRTPVLASVNDRKEE